MSAGRGASSGTLGLVPPDVLERLSHQLVAQLPQQDQVAELVSPICSLLSSRTSAEPQEVFMSRISSDLINLLGVQHVSTITCVMSELSEATVRLQGDSGPHLSRPASATSGARGTRIKSSPPTRARLAVDLHVNPHIFASTVSQSSLELGTLSGIKRTLPDGATRSFNETYEEVVIPPSRIVPMRSDERLLEISDLDSICKPSFHGYKTLNRLQSAVFPIVYNTNENMLVCAPTGAGKTDVALLAILRAASQYGGLDPKKPPKGLKNSFKVVYVAPMKALAAEIVRKMGKRLGWLGMEVRELTGDMQLTREEVNATHLIVTTPEKWDVVTRKASDEEGLVSRVRLLIIDEVHLLHEERGAVIETIVARTLRQVESSQSLIRILGLSATLPNYTDVAEFLMVNPLQGLFYFDASFRPVPLEQHFIGVKGKVNSSKSRQNLDDVTFEKVIELVQEGHQVMVFVHARKETVKTAEMLREKAKEDGLMELFDPSDNCEYESFSRDLAKSRNREMKDLCKDGFGIHHAGMLRSDRNVSERLFERGISKVLCCTATLAWGVNLPAYAVVIKGTQVYDSSKGSFVDLGILDVLQIFGRAGRPQYEDRGVGYICTTHDRLTHYISAATQQHAVESRFVAGMIDALNAEVALGTVRNIDEGVRWIGWTYLFVRMRKNPLVYGITVESVLDDPLLGSQRRSLIETALERLSKIGMVMLDRNTGALWPTQVGKIASKYYIKYGSVEVFNGLLRQKMSEADVLAMISESKEFDQIKVRESEIDELERLEKQAPCQVKGGPTSTAGKVNILLQAYVSRAYVEDFSLVSDTAYVAQNAARISRALVEFAVWKRLAGAGRVSIEIAKCIDRKMWPFMHPMIQSGLSDQLIYDLDQRAGEVEVEELAVMSPAEIAKLCRLNDRLGAVILRAAKRFPRLSTSYSIQPLSNSLLRFRIHVKRLFDWSDQLHGHGEPFWIWIEDAEERETLRTSRFYLRSSMPKLDVDLLLSLASKALPSSLGIRLTSDRWLGASDLKQVSLEGMIMCPKPPPPTPVLNIPLLSVAQLNTIDDFRKVIGLPNQFSPIVSQCIHAVSYTPHNLLVCAPEETATYQLSLLAISRALRLSSPRTCSIVVVTPRDSVVKTLVTSLQAALQQFPVSISSSPDQYHHTRPIKEAAGMSQIVVHTPQRRSILPSSFTQDITLTLLMDLHDMNEEYEIFITKVIKEWETTRLIGFSAPLQEASSISNWLGIAPQKTYNFSPTSRSEPIVVEFQPIGTSYSRDQWRTLVRPAWDTIRASRLSSVLIFVPSHHICRGVAKLLVQCSASTLTEDNQLVSAKHLQCFSDPEICDLLIHGIVILEPRMKAVESQLVIDLFRRKVIRVLVVARELCWHLSHDSIKAELVIALGTRYSASKKAENDFLDTSDPLQDRVVLPELVRFQSFLEAAPASQSTANQNLHIPQKRIIVMCEEEDLMWYEAFLNNGLPLESTIPVSSSFYLDEILRRLARLGQEKGQVNARDDIMRYLADTFLFQRVQENPFYYGIDVRHRFGAKKVNKAQRAAWIASALIDLWVESLVATNCLRDIGSGKLKVTEIGRAIISSSVVGPG